MQRIELEVKPRGLGEQKDLNLNQLRKSGWIPATIYGNGEPASIVVEEKIFNKATHTKAGINALFTIKLGNESSLTVIKEVQRHVLKHNAIHVDFKRIDMKEKLEVNVPTHAVGESPGVKNSGGILEQITREIRVKCLPDNIPVSIDIDVSHLELGHGIKVKDIKPIDGVEIITAPDTIVVNVVAPKIEEEKPAAGDAAAGAAEPEVIAKGKKEEEGAEGAAPAAAGAPAAKGAKPGAPAAAAPAAAKGKDEKKK